MLFPLSTEAYAGFAAVPTIFSGFSFVACAYCE